MRKTPPAGAPAGGRTNNRGRAVWIPSLSPCNPAGHIAQAARRIPGGGRQTRHLWGGGPGQPAAGGDRTTHRYRRPAPRQRRQRENTGFPRTQLIPGWCHRLVPRSHAPGAAVGAISPPAGMGTGVYRYPPPVVLDYGVLDKTTRTSVLWCRYFHPVSRRLTYRVRPPDAAHVFSG